MKIMEHDFGLIEKLIIGSTNQTNSIGLLSGQMGSVIVIAEYSKKYNLPYLEVVSDALFSNVISVVSKIHDFSFSTGMAGVCWGIEYLLQSDILPGTGDEICGSIDSFIMNFDIKRMNDFSLSTGLLGLWLYVKARIQGNTRVGLSFPFDSEYLENWEHVLRSNKNHFPNNDYMWLINKLSGVNITDTPLSYKEFISLPKDFNIQQIKDISLTNGFAGVIAKLYL